MVEGIIFKLTGSVSTASAWQIDSIIFPIGPAGVKVGGGINKEIMPKSADEPTQIVDGLAGTTVTLNGAIADSAKTDVQLWKDYITPLLELRGKEVTFVRPISGLNGVYLLEVFEPSRDAAIPIYTYSLRLSKGSLIVIMQED